jgi:hypothetical protein
VNAAQIATLGDFPENQTGLEFLLGRMLRSLLSRCVHSFILFFVVNFKNLHGD